MHEKPYLTLAEAAALACVDEATFRERAPALGVTAAAQR